MQTFVAVSFCFFFVVCFVIVGGLQNGLETLCTMAAKKKKNSEKKYSRNTKIVKLMCCNNYSHSTNFSVFFSILNRLSSIILSYITIYYILILIFFQLKFCLLKKNKHKHKHHDQLRTHTLQTWTPQFMIFSIYFIIICS